MQSNDRSRSLSPARFSTSRSPSKSRSPTNSRSRSRSRSPSRSRSRSPSPSSSTSRSQIGLYGFDFEHLRQTTRGTRSAQLLSRVMTQAEYHARQGQTSATFWCDIPDDLAEWLVDELRRRDIYAEVIINDDGHYDQIYLELEEYLESESRSSEEGRQQNNKNMYYVLMLLFVGIMGLMFLDPSNLDFSSPNPMVETVKKTVVESNTSYQAFTDTYF